MALSSVDQFRAKRALWLSWLDDDEHHAIWQTLSQMVWKEVTFRTLGHIADGRKGSALNNPVLAEALIDGHVAVQVLAIRRLVDETKGVISLRKLLADVRSGFGLFTRENFITFDGLPYDYETVAESERAARAGSGPFWAETSGPRAYGTSQLMHEHFDRLSGVSASGRRPDDRLLRKLLDRIDRWITESGAEDVAQWSHAYLAHAGSVASRQRIADYGLTGEKIDHAIRGLARAAEGLGQILYAGGRAGALMPTPQFDQFERLNGQVLTRRTTDEAFRQWVELGNGYDDCLNDVRDALLAPDA